MVTSKRVFASALMAVALLSACSLPANGASTSPTPKLSVSSAGDYHAGGNGRGGGINVGGIPKTGASAAYRECMKHRGFITKSRSDIWSFGATNVKLVAALKACANK